MKNQLYVFILAQCTSVALIAQGSWMQKIDYPALNGRESGVGFTINGKGYSGSGKNGLPQFDFWEYDAPLDTWTQKADIPQRRAGAVGFAILGKGYIGLGYDPVIGMLNDMWEYNPVLNTWTQKSSLPGNGRRYSVAFEISNKVYMGLGAGAGAPNPLYNDWWEYDPVTDMWTQKNNFLLIGRSEAAAFAINGYGYVFGGGDTVGRLNDVWQYNAVADAWSQKATIPDTARAASCAFTTGNMGYVFGGETGNYTNDLWQYNPASNAWIAKAPMPAGGRYRSWAFGLNGRGYVIGGNGNSTSYLDEIWEYTPDSVFAGFSEIANTISMDAFPNPTQGIINLSSSKPGMATLIVSNVLGEKVYSNKMLLQKQNMLNFETLKSGMYFLQVQTNGFSNVVKFVKK